MWDCMKRWHSNCALQMFWTQQVKQGISVDHEQMDLPCDPQQSHHAQTTSKNIIPLRGRFPISVTGRHPLEAALLWCCLSLQLVRFHESKEASWATKKNRIKKRVVQLVGTLGCGGRWPKRLDLQLSIIFLILHWKGISLIHLFSYLSCYVFPLNCYSGKAFML